MNLDQREFGGDERGVVDGLVGGQDECSVCGFEGVGGTAYDMGWWNAWWVVGRALRLRFREASFSE